MRAFFIANRSIQVKVVDQAAGYPRLVDIEIILVYNLAEGLYSYWQLFHRHPLFNR